MASGTGTLATVATIARRAIEATGRRALGRLPPGSTKDLDDRAFDATAAFFEASAGGSGPVKGVERFRLPANEPPWLDTDQDLDVGEEITWFAAGRVTVSKLLDISVPPSFQLWARIGDGPVFRGTRGSNSLRAESRGRLRLASYFPGEWKDPFGSLATDPNDYRSASGAIEVIVVRWAGRAEDGLAELAARPDAPSTIAAELDRMATRRYPPDGWKPLWFLGDTEIFDSPEPGRIRCETCCDVGIVRRDVDVELGPVTTLSWEWNVEELPSRLPEHTLPTHDYLSIAVEFDDGIDLTWYWSASLPEETGYWCPLPTWKDREYHVVVRSGAMDLGRWLSERRDVVRDVETHLGTKPQRIVRVWLIANSLFQRGRGACAYRNVRLESGGHRVDVL